MAEWTIALLETLGWHQNTSFLQKRKGVEVAGSIPVISKCRSGGNGRHTGLKILGLNGVRVQVPPSAHNKDNKMDKIIHKNYNSIPHLSTSKLTEQADKKINEKQEKILTQHPRDWKDLIIVTEKIDGSNVGVVKHDGKLVAVSRSGYSLENSRYRHHRAFQQYVYKNESKFSWLPEGWRVVGEWCIQAHGTLYDISEESPFVAFDIIMPENETLIYIDFLKLCTKYSIPMVPLLHIGQPISIKNAIKLLGDGYYGNPEKPEGVVYRVERENKVDYLAKWVRSGKEDGKYLGSITWNLGVELYKLT